MLSFIRDLVSLPFRALAVLRAGSPLHDWDLYELPDDDEFFSPDDDCPPLARDLRDEEYRDRM